MGEKVWKVGSRWSDIGSADMSVLNVFRRNNYVFVGENERFKNEVHAGHYIAIADGYTVVAVAKVLDEPENLSSLIKERKLRFRPQIDKFDFDNPDEFPEEFYAGARVHLLDLEPQDYLYYPKMGTFFAANMYWDKIIDLYNQYSNNSHFDISSRTYRIKNGHNAIDATGYKKEELLDGHTYYVVPVYQREYSWDEEQISRFVRDIFSGFWNVNEERTEVYLKEEPLFIGTMQLSQKRHLSETESEQDIIDGQQRVSTLLCLFKYLSLKYPGDFAKHSIPLNWLETRVNNEKEQGFLNAFLSVNDLGEIKESSENKYIRGCALISNYFDEALGEHIERLFDVNRFINYLLTSIYFVVVETVAGLSKTIQIFNTINTGGLDLSGDDLFKVRLYEYLRDCCGESEHAFVEIGEIYRAIKNINAEWRESGNNYDVVSMSSVRSAYKDYLISRYDLPNGLYQMATDTFYDYLFDGLLGVQHHREMGDKVKNKIVQLSIEEINIVVDAVAKWNRADYHTYGQLISFKLIEKSRYGRYSRIAYLLLLCGYNLDEAYDILTPVSKVFFCYSLFYSRPVNEIHTLAFHLQKSIGANAPREEIIGLINKKLYSEDCLNWGREAIVKQIAHNRIWKDLICCLSAYFDEVEKGIEIKTIDRLISLNYDVEHIHATEDHSVLVRPELQNSIGNLLLLEYSLNRSIGNSTFEEKKICYEKSEYQSIKNLLKYKKWGEKEILERLEQQYQKIATFIWGEK